MNYALWTQVALVLISFGYHCGKWGQKRKNDYYGGWSSVIAMILTLTLLLLTAKWGFP